MSSPRSAMLAALMAVLPLTAACGDDNAGTHADATDTAVDATPDGTTDATTPDGTTDAPDATDATDATTPDGTADAIDDATPDVAPDAADGSDTSDTGDTVDPDDPDGDGLNNAAEAEIGTDPALADTDGDGYWDGWEVSAGSDPLDPLATPALATPAGDPYILDLVDIVEPSLLRSFLGSILDRWPPILIFIDPPGASGGADAHAVTLTGGIAARTALGADDTAGTADDEYGLQLGSLDPKTGAFQVQLQGTRTGDQLVATADQIVIDLSNISEIVRGVKLRVEQVKLEATFIDGGQRLEPTRLSGVLSRAGVEDILENADLPLPISIDQAMQILDPDGDGIIVVDIALKGRPAIASGWSLTPDADPAPRDPGMCCPAGLAVGDAIDPALTIEEQGLQPGEEALAHEVIAQALSHPELTDFVATQRVIGGERRNYVYSPRGVIYFVRDRDKVDGKVVTTYRTYLLADADALEGELIAQDDERNPLADQDPTKISSYAAFLGAGESFDTTPDYESIGYAQGDERLVRIPAGKNPYPFGYERLSQMFDDPRAGDLFISTLSYVGSRGNHGDLTALQSRSPLIVSGPSVLHAGEEAGPGWSIACVGDCTADATHYLVRNEAAHIVDVAPTVAKTLGVAKTTGVGPNGALADDVYLAWQDGRPLDQILSGTHASHALIIVNDGLTSMELLYQALDANRDLGAYRELMQRGVIFRHGAITNFPSNTYPSHNVVGSGAYSGHHGLLDNSFYERAVASSFAPIVELFSTEKFVQSAHVGLPVETLHEAVLRSFGGIWNKVSNPTGILTASLNDPSTRGAPLATLERRVPEGYVVPAAVQELTLAGTTYPYPAADLTDAEGLLDNSTVTNAYGLYIANPAKGFPIPRYAVINFSSTDGAGHKAGPNGDVEREVVLKKTNDRIAILIAILKAAGVFDDMLIVLTADHGMELKDPHVQGDPLAGLSPDVGYIQEHDSIYLKQLVVTRAAGLVPLEQLALTVSDSDGAAPHNLIGGATVVIKRGTTEVARGTTAADGTVTLSVPPGDGTLVATVSKNGFSTEDHPLE